MENIYTGYLAAIINRKNLQVNLKMQETFLSGKSVLLVSPKFFGYELAVKDKLTQMGADVTFIDDRPSNSLISKGLIRLNKKLLETKIAKYYAAISDDISLKKFDIVFLLNPEALPTSFLEMCKSRWGNALYVMYMWDSIKNRKHTLDFIPFCDRIFTFDINDSKTHQFSFEPLFYLDTYSSIRQNNPPIQYDICFMGTLHSDRYAIAKAVRDWCIQNKLRCFFYFFMQSRLLYYINKFRGKGIAPKSEISFAKMSSAEVVNIVGSSRVVLDIQHPKQTGLTMRTLETLGAGRKLITTNDKVRNYDFYNPANITIIDRSAPTQNLDLSFFLNQPQPVSEEIVTNYSIGSWIRHLLEH